MFVICVMSMCILDMTMVIDGGLDMDVDIDTDMETHRY